MTASIAQIEAAITRAKSPPDQASEATTTCSRLLTLIASQPGISTKELQEACGLGYAPNNQLHKLRTSGKVRVEYRQREGRGAVKAHWWIMG